MRITTFKDINLKSGGFIPKGTTLDIFPHPDKNLAASICITKVDSIDICLRYRAVKQEPTIRTMQKWSFDGIAKSISGKPIEPDGWDENGFPSWLLALGFL